VSFTDGRGVVTTRTFDGHGGLERVTSPETGVTRQSFDSAGNLVRREDALGQVTTFAYDALNRPTRFTTHDGGVALLEYDQGTYGRGRLTRVTDSSGTRELQYYPRGTLAREQRTVVLPAGPVVLTTQYTYDGADRVATVRYPSGLLVSYARDALGRVVSASGLLGGTTVPLATGVTRVPMGPMRTAAPAMDRTFDLDGRMSSYLAAGARRALAYDSAGLLSSVSTDGGTLYTYSYDGHARVTGASGPAGSFSFSFDEANNLTRREVAGQVTALSYGASSNRLLAADGGISAAFSYDPAGRLLGDGRRQLEYDALGRLVEVRAGNVRVQYLIDSLGFRVGRVVR
jgi:YD repeat-containing protein